ncbi:RNase adapter RapZ [Succinivibrio dextrinosolvens]|uniref:RNase adapter RapZ n=1 Tax=Succinivibrio dextrinosolvens TaxID=83771 RepID=UPI00241D3FB7|nr:RNase adapter RapZ [Succinivibrio dextrinosolvens]MBE6423538.1 RNase adapter RapZ [Succinivibrio dextrinosolvens]
MHNQVDLVVISGRSGSGKTVALHALEDLGFYCVDNLPVELLYNMIDLAKKSYPKIAISIDVRNLPDSGHEDMLNDIYLRVNNDPDIDSTIIFIDADDQVLIKRYSETRRLHPLSQKNLTLNEAIQKETEILKIISSVADLRIDTTNLSIHDLCKNVISSINGKPFKEVVLIFESFGYKDGITKDADFVFDARFLPNPYWDKSIRQYCGLEEPIRQFFSKYPEVENYINKLDDLLLDIMPAIEVGDRSYLTVAVGCTGGFHRSVYIAQTLADRFKERGTNVKVRHRTLMKMKK